MNGPSAQLQLQPNSNQMTSNQSPWANHAGPSQTQGLNVNQLNQGNSLGQAQHHNPNPSPLPRHTQANHLQQGVVPPRSGHTPQQHLLGQASGPQMSPNISNQFPFQQAGQGNAQPPNQQNTQLQQIPIPPPLDKARFENAYKSYCQSKSIHHDPRLMSNDNRPIDLYELHKHVMLEGGGAKVHFVALFLRRIRCSLLDR
jgi:hypothetical protein